MITAKGARISVTASEVVVTPTALAASLRASSSDTVVQLASITGVTVHPGDAWAEGRVELLTAGASEVIEFGPGDSEGPDALRAMVEKALRGDAPKEAAADGQAGIPGFDFVALDVETANQNWGSICQIGMVKIVDGEEVDRVTWKCCPPKGIDSFDPFNVGIHGITQESVADCPSVGELIASVEEFIGDLPLVAHNAQFDASALRDAAIASGVAVPKLMFACTLAQSRATKLDVENHKLPTLANHFGVELDNHHDAGADAYACAGIMVGLARLAAYEGSVMGFVHDAGFALGSIDADRVTPVLRDRSGAMRALQVQKVQGGGMPAAVDAVSQPQGNNQGDGPSRWASTSPDDEQTPAAPARDAKPQRNAPPWQAVATPDTIPEPNPQADPDSVLYGENVTLTGDFEPYDKGELWAGIAHHGGQVGKNVTKKTTILVTGEWATMTSKEKRARELQDKGQEIHIWTAEQLLDALGYER